MKALIDDDVIEWPRLIELLTRTPAALCALEAINVCCGTTSNVSSAHGLGSLREGGVADITVIDPKLAWTIDVATFASKSRNCPFDGWKVRGRATHTVVGGRVVFELALT